MRVLAHAIALTATAILLTAAVAALPGATFRQIAVIGVLLLLVLYLAWPKFHQRADEDGFPESESTEPSGQLGTGPRSLAAVIALLLYVLFRSLFFHIFEIQGGSMRPNHPNDNWMVVSKYAYGYSKHSFPAGLINFSGRLFGSGPARGDVVVYINPKNGGIGISRVIGIGGDNIQMVNGAPVINGTTIPQSSRPADEATRKEYPQATVRTESLPNGVTYDTLDSVANGLYDNTNLYAVPTGHVFVMGDNRDNSIDSRALPTIGYIPIENVIGRVVLSFRR